MIIEAGSRFVCTHRYIVQITPLTQTVPPEKRLMLVCEHCGHRVEQLHITQDRSQGRVIAFPPPRVAKWTAPATDRHNDPPPLLSA